VKGERDEALKAVRLVLQGAQLEQVIDAVLEGLDVPVEHGAVGAHAEAVRHAVHLQVLRAVGLALRDASAHVLGQDLGAAARHTVEPRSAQTLQHLAVAHLELLGEVVDLDRREALQVHVGAHLLPAA
jgi:hypothetical protein